ncbi:MAG: hypothetical protein Q4Q06_06160 [Bacteroidota bacterium]|nr:hypothetical protein [Bacteroidota bacterium]
MPTLQKINLRAREKRSLCKVLVLIAFLLCANLVAGQEEDQKEIAQSKEIPTKTRQDLSEESTNMFVVLWKDYWQESEHRKQKRECYWAYTKMCVQATYSQISAPIGYVVYYLCRKPITKRIENLYKEKNLDNIENIGKDILQEKITKEELQEALKLYYQIWLYGDTDDPLVTGGVPKDYKSDLPMFIRRWLYCGVRNPRWNATYINFYSDSISEIHNVLDNRQNIVTHNYGTGDTRLGNWLRWYVDESGKWWFFYENTKKTGENKGKLFYFGAVGLSNMKASDLKKKKKRSRFEFSLNREVKID